MGLFVKAGRFAICISSGKSATFCSQSVSWVMSAYKMIICCFVHVELAFVIHYDFLSVDII